MATTYLQRSTGTPTSQTKFTVSAWVKRSGLHSSNNMDMLCIYSDSSNRMHLRFQGDDIDVINYGGSTQARLTTDRKFRDTSAWYHIVWRVDTTLATADDRVRLYINGVQETSFSSRTNPSQNFNFGTNWNITRIGLDDNAAYFDGIMSHFHYSDGYSYGPDTFGSTDSTTGEWKINTSPTFTLGNNGFTVLKDGNTITDQSSNSNDFSAGGATLTKTEDNPSNVFCTLNPLDYNSTTMIAGNNRIAWSQAAGNFAITTGTLGITTGKYYWEVKLSSDDNSTGIHLGVIQTTPYISRTTAPTVNTSLFYGLGTRLTTAKAIYKTSNGVDSSISDTWSNDVIIRVAYDGDAGKIYMWKGTSEFNGQTFSSNTSFNDATLTAGTMVLPYVAFGDGGSGTKNAHAAFNFGNGYFRTTQISSAGTNASGNGIFEYDVPTGYTALSTKGLNT